MIFLRLNSEAVHDFFQIRFHDKQCPERHFLQRGQISRIRDWGVGKSGYLFLMMILRLYLLTGMTPVLNGITPFVLALNQGSNLGMAT